MDVRMPNGVVIRNVPTGTKRSALLEKLAKNGYDTNALLTAPTTPEPEKEYAGLVGSFLESAGTLGAADEAAAWAANPSEENRRAVLEKADSNYKTASFGLTPTEDLSVLGRNWEALKETLGGTLGFIAAPALAGTAAAAATGALSGPGAIVSAPLAGGIAGYSTAGAQYATQNLIRQAQEQQRAIDEGRAATGPNVGAALVGAAGQTALDVAGGRVFGPLLSRFPLLRNLALGDDKVARESLEVIQDAVNKGTLQRTAGGTFRGVGGGIAFEVPQEIAQQAIERTQAGLSLTDEEARQEFIQAGVGAAVLGGVAGGVQARYAAPRQQLQQREVRAVRELTNRYLEQGENDFNRLVSAYRQDYENRTGRTMTPEEAVAYANRMEANAVAKGNTPLRLTPEEAQRKAARDVAARRVVLTDDSQRRKLEGLTEGVTGEEIAAAQSGPPSIVGPQLRASQEQGEMFPLPADAVPEPKKEPAPASAIKQKKLKAVSSYKKEINQLIKKDLIDEEQADSFRKLITPEAPFQKLSVPVASKLLYETAEANAARGSTTTPKPKIGLTPLEEFAEKTELDALFEAERAEEASLMEKLEAEQRALQDKAQRQSTAQAASAVTEQLDRIQAERTALNRAALLKETIEESAVDVQRRSLEGGFYPYATLARQFEEKLKKNKFANSAPTEEEASKIDALARLIIGRGRTPVEKEVIPSPPGSVQLEGMQAQIPAAPTKPAVVESQPSFPGFGRRGATPPAQPAGPEEAPTRKVEPVKITANLLNSFGVPKINNMVAKQFGAKLRKAVVGKNTSDPAVQQHIADYLKETPRGAISDNTRYALENLIGRRDVAQRELFQPKKSKVALAEESVSALEERAAVKSRLREPTDEDIKSIREPLNKLKAIRASADKTILEGGKLDAGAFRVELRGGVVAALNKLNSVLSRVRGTPLNQLGDLVEKGPRAEKVPDFQTLLNTANTALDAKDLTEARVNLQAIKDGIESDRWVDLLVTREEEKRYGGVKAAPETEQAVQFGPPLDGPTSGVGRTYKLDINVESLGKLLQKFRTKNAKENIKRAKAFLDAALAEKSITASQHKLFTESLANGAKPDQQVAAAMQFAVLNRIAPEPNTYKVSGSMRFRRNYATAKGMLVDDVKKVVSRLTADWKSDLNVEVVQNVDRLPKNIAVQVTAMGVDKVKGLAVRDGNTVFIIADNMDSEADVASTLFHEALGHAGLTRAFGGRLNTVLRNIYDTNPEYKTKADKWLAENPDSYVEESDTDRQIRALEEVLAEEAEAGRAPTSLLARIMAVIKDFARALGIPLKYSKTDIGAVLAKAHDIVANGGKRAPLLQETDPKVALKITRAAAMQAKMEGARFYDDSVSNISRLLNEFRSSGSVLSSLNKSGILPMLARRTLRGVLTMMTTDDITRLYGNTLPLDQLNKLVTEMAVSRGRAVGGLVETLNTWKTFNAKYPAQHKIMDKALISATLAQINPAKDKRPARPDTLEVEVFNLYDSLNAEGKAIFSKVLDSFESVAKEEPAAYLKIIANSSLEGSIDDPDTDKGRIYRELSNIADKQEKLRVYFPLMRFGQYSFALGEDSTHEYYMFESEAARNRARDERIAELEADSDPKMKDLAKSVRSYNGIKDLSSDITKYSPDSALTRITATLNKSSLEASDKQAIANAAMQLFIRTLPDQNTLARLRRRAERKEITGFSTDTFRVFASAQVTSINRNNRLAYKWQLPVALSNIKKAIADKKDLSQDEIGRLETVLAELESRVNRELDPRTYDSDFENFGDRAARLGNQATFYWFLSSPKQAIINFTQGPAVVAPVLAAKYGVSIPTMLKLMTQHARLDKDANTLFNFDSSLKKIKDPDAKAAFEKMYKDRLQSGFFEETRLADAYQLGRVPSTGGSTFSEVQSKLGRVLRFAFQQSEMSLRQITYATAFELAFDKAMKSKRGKPQAQAIEEATREADETAVSDIYNTLFNYTQWNKPTLFTAHWSTRLATQFMSFPLQMSSILIRSFYNMYSTLNTKEERVMAAKQFWGMMMMTGVMGGVTGLPLYPLIAGLMDALANDLGGDDDEDTSNPMYLQDSDFWFREWWIPSVFGSGSGLARTLNLSDEQAALLSRTVKYGPVSALTGLDVASSVSLADLPFLFLMPDLKGTLSPEDNVKSALYDTALGPLGGLLSMGGTAYKDFSNGDWYRGMEALMPNFIKGIVTAGRYSMEGYRTRTDDEVAGREWFTAGRLVGQGLGFRPIEMTEAQNALFDAIQADRELDRERSRILDRIDRARRDGNMDEVRRLFREEVIKFNREYPTLAITLDNLLTSAQNRQRIRAESVGGLNTSNRGLDRFEREIMGQYAERLRAE